MNLTREEVAAPKTGGIIILDFDGTCVAHQYPGVGEDIGAIPVLIDLVKRGHKLVLNTMRSNRDEGLADALAWFDRNGLPLYGVNQTPGQTSYTDSPKVHGDLAIDDLSVGMPLVHTRVRGSYVDWHKVREILESTGWLPLPIKK
tara:strand:+ start:390 stop:824 length:435 start_codon:yes stop_codon:yes gene_type:complete